MATREQLIATMRGHAPTLRALGYRVKFVITDEPGVILLDATGGKVVVSEDDEEADAVLTISSADLGKLMSGRLSPMLAFSMGKLKVEGSKGVAMKLASLLDD